MNIALSAGDRARLPWIAAAFAPVLVVQGIRLLTSGSVSGVRANTVLVDSQAALSVTPPPVPTSEQQKALAWIKTHGRGQTIHDPLSVPAPVATPEPSKLPDVVQPAPVAIETPAPIEQAPPLAVSGVMGSGPGALATVNHKVCRIGDILAPDWTLVSVDSRKRSITVRHTDGREVEIVAGTSNSK